MLRILAQLSSGSETDLDAGRLCDVCADVSGMSGAGIMLMVEDAHQRSFSSNDVSARIEELQQTLGEGPCVDACHADRPVLEPDLADPDTPRWSAFTPPAVEAGARAVFGFPLQVGTVRFGALNLYRDRPGPLSGEQYANALVLADVAARAVLAMQTPAPSGVLAAELAEGGHFRSVVHQASGMMAVQLGVSVGDALARLRAHACAEERPLEEVSEEVVGRHLRFNKDHRPGGSEDRDGRSGAAAPERD